MEIQRIVALQPEQFFANNKSFKLIILSREAEIVGHRYCITTNRVRFSSHQVHSTCQIEGDPGPDWVYFSVRKSANSSLLIGRSGVSTGGYAVSVLGSAGMAVTGAGYSSFTVGVRRDLLSAHPSFFAEHAGFLQKSTSYRINEALFSYLNARFGELEGLEDSGEEIEEQELERQILDTIITLLTCLDADDEINSGNRQRIVFTALKHVAKNADRKVSTRELAEVSHCSIRTLQYAFRKTLGISPKSYGDRYRLALFREALMRPEMDDCRNQKIHQLGQEFGFSHAGNLAKTYRELYGRLPSQDCNCDPRTVQASDLNFGN